MRNRAKCKLCNSIIESFHSEDYVNCKCDEICVYGGPAMRCAAKNFDNFIRVDDQDNEIVPVVIDKTKKEDEQIKLTKGQLIDMLAELIDSIHKMPSHAMTQPITHYDLSSALGVLLAIFRAEAS